jgi:hypothetical protein
MKIKLLFFIGLSLLLSSCYTHVRYVYVDEPVDEVYIYDVNYIYANLWYDDFFWRYDTRISWYYDNYYYGLFYYSPRYYAYPYHYRYKPYYKHRRSHYKSRPFHKRKLGHLARRDSQLKPKKLKQRYYLDKDPVQIKSRSKDRHKINRRKTIKNNKNNVHFKSRFKKNNSFKKRTIIRQRNNKTQVSKMKPKFRKKTNTTRTKVKRSTPTRRSKVKRSAPIRNKTKRSTKKGRR